MVAEKKYTKKASLFGGLFKKSSENSYSQNTSSKPTKPSSRPNTRTKQSEEIAPKPAQELKANQSIFLSLHKSNDDEYAISKMAEEAQNKASGLDYNLTFNREQEDLSNLKIQKDSKLFKKPSILVQKPLENDEKSVENESKFEETTIKNEDVFSNNESLSTNAQEEKTNVQEVNSNSNNVSNSNTLPPLEFAKKDKENKIDSQYSLNENQSYLLIADKNASKNDNRLKSKNSEKIRVGTLDEISEPSDESKEKWQWNLNFSATSLVMTFGGLLLTLGFFFSFGLFVGRGLTPEATALPLASIVPDNENVIIKNADDTLKPEELEYAKVLKTVVVEPVGIDPNKIYLDKDGKIMPAGTYVIGPDDNLLPENTIILGADGKAIATNTIRIGEDGKAISTTLAANNANVPYPIGQAEIVTPSKAKTEKITEPAVEKVEEVKEVAPPKMYDYVIRAASFKDEELADNLRATLEGDGMRTQLARSKSWYLVNINYRGTEANYEKLRSNLRKHRITDSIIVSKVEVAKSS